MTTTGGGSNATGGGAGAPMTGGAAGTTGGTSSGGRGGTGGTGSVDAGACPNNRPANGTGCATAGEVCDYTGFACTCGPAGMTRDGGIRDGWACVRVDGGGAGGTGGGTGADASACPRVAPGNGTRCMAAGEVCPYAFENCTCAMGAGMVDRWACTFAGRDGGRRGDGG